MSVFIYELIDPRSNEIRYVGKTINVVKRLIGHLAGKDNANKAKWIKELKLVGLKPIMNLIEECENNIGAERELFYIESYREKGYDLFNIADPASQRRRFHFFIEDEYYDLLNKKKEEHGFKTTGAFVRYIIRQHYKVL